MLDTGEYAEKQAFGLCCVLISSVDGWPYCAVFPRAIICCASVITRSLFWNFVYEHCIYISPQPHLPRPQTSHVAPASNHLWSLV